MPATATKKKERLRPDIVASFNSPNQSTRLPGPIDLIVIHSTEGHNRPGNEDLVGVGSWFMQTAAQASSHVCTDGDGHSARFVPDEAKAWHVANFNSRSLGIEQIGLASEGLTTWKGREAQIDETARWIALWSIKFGIPIRKGIVNGSAGTVQRGGIVEHHWLGIEGGGHVDPGPYPFQELLRKARRYKHLIRAAA